LYVQTSDQTAAMPIAPGALELESDPAVSLNHRAGTPLLCPRPCWPWGSRIASPCQSRASAQWGPPAQARPGTRIRHLWSATWRPKAARPQRRRGLLRRFTPRAPSRRPTVRAWPSWQTGERLWITSCPPTEPSIESGNLKDRSDPRRPW